jgi:DNA polymerase V
MGLVALVDCNNFYASCERVFNPLLHEKPIVVLSNNDGCIIARSNEAKKLGIPMGAPYFKWKDLCRKEGVFVFSSNYELYGDMSQRVMTALRENSPNLDIYSIDEAFINLDNFSQEQSIKFALHIVKIIKQYIGLPISIGISSTKTLAKIGNHIAKSQAQEGVYYISANDKFILQTFPLDKVWGIGRRLAEKLQKMQLQTAYDLQQSDPRKFRYYFSVMVEKTIHEGSVNLSV